MFAPLQGDSAAHLHRLYIGHRKRCRVFPPAGVIWSFGGARAQVLSLGPVQEIEVDILYLALIGVFLLLALALVAGCSALERKK